MKADSADLSNTTVIGSKENQLFQDYQKYIAVKGKQLQAERTAYMQSKTKEDSALHEANYARYNKELGDYRENVIKTYPGSMMAALFNAMKEPTVPNKSRLLTRTLLIITTITKHITGMGSLYGRKGYLHAFLLPKLERYYREVMPQAPDNLIKILITGCCMPATPWNV